MNIIRDKNAKVELPEEAIVEKLKDDSISKKERRKLKTELFIRRLKLKPPRR